MNIDKESFLAATNSLADLKTTSPRQIETIARELYAIADSQGDAIALLHLLRALEQVHRDIQADYFQAALPDSRQALFTLLRDIEESGGWPYIQRWKIQSLLANLSE